MEKVTKLTKKIYLKQKNKILIGNILQANKHLDWLHLSEKCQSA